MGFTFFSIWHHLSDLESVHDTLASWNDSFAGKKKKIKTERVANKTIMFILGGFWKVRNKIVFWDDVLSIRKAQNFFPFFSLIGD